MKRISAIVAIAIYISVGLAVSWAILVSLTMLFNSVFPMMLGMEEIVPIQMLLLILFTILFKKITL
jgi:hypothetical protein